MAGYQWVSKWKPWEGLPEAEKLRQWKEEAARFCRYWPRVSGGRLKYFCQPDWADRLKIKEVYMRRKEMQKESPVKLHVDHYYPLRGEKVCGLHVHENLQIITAKENFLKSNYYEVE
jgi:hypothetical protein